LNRQASHSRKVVRDGNDDQLVPTVVLRLFTAKKITANTDTTALVAAVKSSLATGAATAIASSDGAFVNADAVATVSSAAAQISDADNSESNENNGDNGNDGSPGNDNSNNNNENTEQNCPANLANKVIWVKNKWGSSARIFMTSPDGLYVITNVKNAASLPVNIRNDLYTGFLMFSKKKCGNIFLDGLMDGTVKMHMFDREKYDDGPSYEIVNMHKRDDSNNLVVQFRQNKIPVGTATTGNTGNKKKDMIHIVYTGLKGIKWPDMNKCFEKIQIAIMKDDIKNWSKCVSNMRSLN